MRDCYRPLFGTSRWLVWATIVNLAPAVRADAPIDFDADVATVLITRCLDCHNSRTASGSLVLDTAAALRRGGDSGAVIDSEHPEDSLLLQRVLAGEMPPEKKGHSQKLPDAEVAVLRQWIAAGASWPDKRTLDLYERTTSVRAGRDWWSLQPVQRPDPPQVISGTSSNHPMDAFILSKLEAEGMKPAARADRRTLIRRVHFDLIGLPPTYEEVEAFAADDAPDAYEKLIDRLLASPHYGERWARYWLDLVRFAETSGYERDQEKPYAWKYRDWVINAFNDDMPYDRFVIEQLAGDELPDRNESTVSATGMLRLGTWNDEPNDPEDYKYERLEDLVHVTTAGFLGATVKCARCHDHKFDPIPQTDYYRIAAAFWPGPVAARGADLVGGPSKDELGFETLGWTDITKEPPPFHLLKKGERTQPAEVVEAGTLSMIPSMDETFVPPSTDARTTRRRLQLAEWMVQPTHPLTARVYVNRLWQHHFGQGLVRTPDNFGFTGDPPSHPALLDWLADELVRGGWRTKRLHKLILTSATYQQASIHPDDAEYSERDSQNRWLWRASRRRLDAEALRDAMLTVSGQIDLSKIGGESFKPKISQDALEGLSRKGADLQVSPPEAQRRRSLYLFSRRSLIAPMMTTFDFCDTTLPCGQRDVSVVAPQALALLNGDFAHEQSRAVAAKVLEAAGSDRDKWVEEAWKMVLLRAPTASEKVAAREHLEQQHLYFQRYPLAEELTLTSLCHALLNCNEFIYVD